MQPLDHPHMMTVPSTIKLDERFEDDVPLCVVAGFRFDIREFRTGCFSEKKFKNRQAALNSISNKYCNI